MTEVKTVKPTPGDPSTTVTSSPSTTIVQGVKPSPSEKKNTGDKGDSQEERCDYDESKPLDGLFLLLHSKCSGNPHLKGLVYITASTTVANHPWQIIDPGWTSHWVSDNNSDQWIKFDFKTSRMFLTHYTLKSYNYVAGGNHMRSWVVDGSTNDNDWLEIDRRQSVNDLNDRYKVKTYQCKNPGAFRFIRIMQTGKTHCDSDIMALTNVEFFGTLRID